MGKIVFLIFFSLIISVDISVAAELPTVRIKDIAHLSGIKENQITGYGLVVGLEGTGDSNKTFFTTQSIANMLHHLGITVDKSQMTVSNVAAVIATATLPPFARIGDKINITISSLGDASTLQGGILLQTPLLAADKNVYAVAQGAVSLGGSNIKTGGTKGQKNHSTVAIVPQGAIIEKEFTSCFVDKEKVSFVLNSSDFTTAKRVVKAINEKLNVKIAKAIDPSLIEVRILNEYKDEVVNLISEIENLTLIPDIEAKVVINERTGTVVIGSNVRISQVAVSHGSLSVTITEEAEAEKPGALPTATTSPTKATIKIQEKEDRLSIMPASASVENLVRALNAVGTMPRDIIAILQAIKAAGALHAEIIIM
ncbi:flagellar basal body P-ring protein FlgI [bacterium]|nr:flagellar basal body P-ring protein FlgI [bacterium]MBU1153827.1 flagellar basal body P-ring protein FlgI [bacterium]